jgi:hypothetical protein
MAHLRLRILPDGSPLYTVVMTVGGTQVEEYLDGVGSAELQMIPGGSLLRLNITGGRVEMISERQEPKDQSDDVGGDKIYPAAH